MGKTMLPKGTRMFLGWLAWILLLVGGFNWLLVGLFNFNLVETIFQIGWLITVVYVLVGLSAVYLLIPMKIRFK